MILTKNIFEDFDNNNLFTVNIRLLERIPEYFSLFGALHNLGGSKFEHLSYIINKLMTL